MRIPKSGYLTLFLAGCVLAVLGWGLQTYVDLVRLEASVVDTRARVEAASRIRLELVENLLRDVGEDGNAEAMAQVDRAAERVREVGLLPAAFDDEKGPQRFRAAQEELNRALEEVWKRHGRTRDPSVGVVISDLKPEIGRWSHALEESLAQLETYIESFRSSTSRFPGSLIASIPRREGTVEDPRPSATAYSDTPAPVEGAVR